ncbi:MAG: hypothetical protein E7069_12035 [Bacteroidales bacterium]|nr:hypothetical protein [Bacteroidales bacterium]
MKMAITFKRPPRWWYFVLFVMLVILLMTRCKSATPIFSNNCEELPQSTQMRIEYRDRLVRDTTYVRDSIYVKETADTIYVNRWRDRYTERIKIDTCYCLNTDTIYIVRRVYVKEPMTRWQNIKQEAGGMAIGWAIISVLIAIVVMSLFVFKH